MRGARWFAALRQAIDTLRALPTRLSRRSREPRGAAGSSTASLRPRASRLPNSVHHQRGRGQRPAHPTRAASATATWAARQMSRRGSRADDVKVTICRVVFGNPPEGTRPPSADWGGPILRAHFKSS